ncbi:hypothetical protein SAMN05216167_101367 [Spirosoma endophyticum]|uniref:Uncharacterized protein n=1 Tax=Spirosoma endophyticum TaxID=662367 RepID=A0A1I1G2D4_9BACT|nr:hypothetical protein SAMN05216167_101367 [Spirosoma endophyticum]
MAAKVQVGQRDKNGKGLWFQENYSLMPKPLSKEKGKPLT